MVLEGDEEIQELIDSMEEIGKEMHNAREKAINIHEKLHGRGREEILKILESIREIDKKIHEIDEQWQKNAISSRMCGS